MFIVTSSLSVLTSFGFNVYRLCTLPHESDEFLFAIVLLLNLGNSNHSSETIVHVLIILCSFHAILHRRWGVSRTIFWNCGGNRHDFPHTVLCNPELFIGKRASWWNQSNVDQTILTSAYLNLFYFLPQLFRLGISAVLAPPVLVLGGLLSRHYWQSGFLVFRTVGARQDLQNACRLLFLSQTLLSFGAQAMVIK